MKLCVIGTGYVGLVTGACLADVGHEVYMVGRDKEKIKMIQKGKSPIYEKGLDELLGKNIGKNLIVSDDLKKSVLDSDIVFICVGTPSKKDGDIDLSQVEDVIDQIALTLKEENNPKYRTIVMKSTVSPGTSRGMYNRLTRSLKSTNIGIAMNPEFLREGSGVSDFMYPDRIVIGELDSKAGDLVHLVYSTFTCPIYRTTLETAEMIKYASNAFLATKISFINEVGNICKKLGIDSYDVAKGIGLDARISSQFLKSGIGYGGSCFPKDVAALISKAQEIGYDPILLRSVQDVNHEQPLRIVEIINKKCSNLKEKKIGILGLSFKPDTDDMRDAPSIPVINKLLEQGYLIKTYDPEALENAKKIFGERIDYTDNIKEAIDYSHVIAILTEWGDFKDPTLYKGKTVIDGRNTIEKRYRDSMDYEGVCW